VLLTVAEARGPALAPLLERATITRLGAGVDRTRRLADDACARTLACLRDYAAELRRAEVTELDVVGTSALRDALGGEALCAAAAEVLGVRPRVISGEEEARLTFAGSLLGLDVAGEVLVVDVGGGSTELITGTRHRDQAMVEVALSLDVGSVRLFERHLRSDPPLPAELAQARDAVRSALAEVAPPSTRRPLIGVAGTVTTLAAVAQRLDPYDGARVHGSSLDRAEVTRLLGELGAMPLDRRARVPGLEPARADVILTGGVVVEAVMEWAGAERLVVSDRGVRWGLLAALRARTSPM